MKTTDHADTDHGNPSDGRRAKYLVVQSSRGERSNPRSTVLGDLIVAAFDEAGRSSTDPREVSRLAARSLRRVLRRARNVSIRIGS